MEVKGEVALYFNTASTRDVFLQYLAETLSARPTKQVFLDKGFYSRSQKVIEEKTRWAAVFKYYEFADLVEHGAVGNAVQLAKLNTLELGIPPWACKYPLSKHRVVFSFGSFPCMQSGS